MMHFVKSRGMACCLSASSMLSMLLRCDTATTIQGVVIEDYGAAGSMVVIGLDELTPEGLYMVLPAAQVFVADVSEPLSWLLEKKENGSLDEGDIVRATREVDFSQFDFRQAVLTDEKGCFFELISIPAVQSQVLAVKVYHPTTKKEYHAIYVKTKAAETVTLIVPASSMKIPIGASSSSDVVTKALHPCMR